MWIYADTLREVKDMESELNSIYRDEAFAEQLADSLLDECYPTYQISGTKFYPSEIVKKLVRSLYNQIMAEEIERLIADDLYWLEHAIPERVILNDGEKLGHFIARDIDYIIWKFNWRYNSSSYFNE